MNVRWEEIPPQGKEIILDGLPTLLSQIPREGDTCITLTSAVKGKLFLRHTLKGLEATGHIETTVTLRCARCLKEFYYPIVTDFEEFFLLTRYASSEDESELLPEEMNISFLPEDGLELCGIIEEQIWLNIPMKPLCYSQCKGLCGICGMDLNLKACGCDRDKRESRFALLKDFKPNLSSRSR